VTDSDGEQTAYDATYAEFDSPLMRQLRHDSYTRDVGQHSWLDAEELLRDLAPLRLSSETRLLDLGCGAAGPLAYVVESSGCLGTGIDVSADAIGSGQARAATLGLDDRISLHEGDLNDPLPFRDASFDAVMSWDAVLHVRDRLALFREVARVIAAEGRFLFTDAGVVTGAVSNEEIGARAMHGFTQFVPPGFNERALEEAGFLVLDQQDRTRDVISSAKGRLAARAAHRDELLRHEGEETFRRQERYLEAVVDLSQRGAVSRMLYLGERSRSAV